ncbi:MAG: hypothetical protein ACRYG4_22640 [Janthinobacterium lividum]
MPMTNFPEPIGLAASFDASLVHDVAGVISIEVRALHTLGRQTGKLGRIGTLGRPTSTSFVTRAGVAGKRRTARICF